MISNLTANYNERFLMHGLIKAYVHIPSRLNLLHCRLVCVRACMRACVSVCARVCVCETYLELTVSAPEIMTWKRKCHVMSCLGSLAQGLLGWAGYY